jgi:uncharacterized protein (TIGR02266 family)
MTQDTRKDRRVKIVSLNVRYKSATVDEFIENHAYDVSRGGIFIKTANPFPPGTLLKFEIRLASDQAVIAGVGRIVWKRDAGISNGDRPAGMGVKFIKIDEPSKVVIDRLVNTKADAGRAYEANDDATHASDRPPPRATSIRPAAGSPPQPPPHPRGQSMSPAAGVAAAAKGPSAPPTATPSGPPPRKSTMIGLGSSSPAGASSPPGSPSTSPPRRSPFPAAPSVPPRPGTAAAMFPKADAEKDWPTKQEPTVMKQAAELLEEALREAGGSMEEIGTNPLFSGASDSASRGVQEPKSPVASASEWTTDDPHESETVAAPAHAVGASMLDHGTGPSSDAAPAPVEERPPSARPAPAAAREPANKDVARASAQAPAEKKGSGGTLLFVAIAAAAVIVGLVVFRDQLFGGGNAPAPAAAPSVAPPAPSAAPMGSVPALTIVPSTTVVTSASSEATKPSVSAQPSASSSPSAAASAAATGHASAEVPSATVSPAPVAAPRPRPVARPVPPVTATATTAAPTETAPAAPAPTETASAAPAPSAKPTLVLPKKPTKPTDDNPY